MKSKDKVLIEARKSPGAFSSEKFSKALDLAIIEKTKANLLEVKDEMS